ncbi:MAG: hypothetical protein E2O39_06240, partial [Planctomycetota bacterium]
MSSRDSLLVALVAAVGGLGAGFLFASLLQDSGLVEASGPGFAGQPDLPAYATSGPTPTLDAPARDIQRAPAVVPVEAPTARVPAAELERALDAIAAPSIGAARGEGSITGEVLDAAGTPL